MQPWERCQSLRLQLTSKYHAGIRLGREHPVIHSRSSVGQNNLLHVAKLTRVMVFLVHIYILQTVHTAHNINTKSPKKHGDTDSNNQRVSRP